MNSPRVKAIIAKMTAKHDKEPAKVTAKECVKGLIKRLDTTDKETAKRVEDMRKAARMAKLIKAENEKYDLPFMCEQYKAMEKHLAALDKNGNCDPEIYAVYKNCLVFMKAYLRQFGK